MTHDESCGESANESLNNETAQQSVSLESWSREGQGCDHHVVGIGASAGGLEALEKLFAGMPLDSGMSFVVIQHLSPDFESHMKQLLGRITKLPIYAVTDGMKIEPNAIYLIPPRMEMVVSNGRLLLTERSKDRVFTHPIDQFFRALAHDSQRFAVGVVLSGTGSDGSRGISDIRECGGLVIAQEPTTCGFDSMPRNAQKTGHVHLTLPPEAIAEALTRYVQEGSSPNQLRDRELVAYQEEGISRVFQLLQRAHGIDFANYKASTVGRRIQRQIDLMNVSSLDEYIDRLNRDPEAVNRLYQDLLIGVTRFFRDLEAFRVLEDQIIPELVKNANGSGIRAWVCGCATGEEAYSLAILFAEATERLGKRCDIKLFATDAHKISLQTAATGIYPEDKLADVSEQRRSKFFIKRKDGFHVKAELRRMLVFAPHNIINDPPFTQMHLVTCRNLLIYLQPNAQQKTLSLFHFALKQSGILFLGPSESPGEIGDEFEAVESRWKIFRKRRDVRLPIEMRMPLGSQLPNHRPPQIRRKSDTHGSDTLGAFYDVLISEVMPQSVLVGSDFEIMHTFGGAEAYFQFSGGRPSTNLLDVVHPQLKTALAGALQHALKDNKSVCYSGLPNPQAEIETQLRLTVEPKHATKIKTTALLVKFEAIEAADDSLAWRRPDGDAATKVEEIDVGDVSAARIEALETELSQTRQNLQATIEELETSNEELQATNEEMVASNEELQSTNEELHGVNEELFTVNAEHQARLQELRQANDDMDNLLASTRVGVIFLDNELHIRRFTPEIARVFHLVEQDVGRSIQSFTHNLQYRELLNDLNQVVASGTEKELEVTDQSGGVYLVRMQPYHSDHRIAGVVMAFVDVSKRKEQDARLRLLGKAIDSVVNGIVIADAGQANNPITFANAGFLKMTGYQEEEVLGQNCRFLQGAASDPQVVKQISNSIERGESVSVLLQNYRKNGEPFWNDLYITPVRGDSQEITHFVGVQNDVSQLVDAGERARENETAIQLLLDSTAEGIFGIDGDGNCTFCNRSAARMLGYVSPEELLGKAMHELAHHSHRDGTPLPIDRCAIHQTLRHGERTNVSDEVFWRADGRPFPVEYWSRPIRREGEIVGAVITFVDISRRLQTESQLKEARRQADGANVAKSQFLANMSHELRTPLAAIMGFTGILFEESHDEGTKTTLSAIHRNGEHLLTLLNDVLDLSKIEAGAVQLNATRFDLAENLRDLNDMMQVRAADMKRTLVFHCPERLPKTVTTDAARLRQVLVNVIGNGLKFAPDGKVDVTVRMLSEGSAGADVATPALHIEVADDGIGIDPEHLKRLFRPFTQADTEIAQRFGGTGLGLSISKRLIESLGGTIEVDSTKGEGSKFTICVPVSPMGELVEMHLHEPPDGNSEPESNLTPHKAGQLTAHVLIADDMRDIRYIARHFLRKAGCTVDIAENGRDAVDRVVQSLRSEQPHYDIVLMDVQMPILDGEQAMHELRKLGFRRPVIALTADAMKGTRKRLLDAGFDAYLTKPVNAAKLLSVVRSLLTENEETDSDDAFSPS